MSLWKVSLAPPTFCRALMMVRVILKGNPSFADCVVGHKPLGTMSQIVMWFFSLTVAM